MALDRALVTIPLAQGLDTKTDPFQVAPGKLRELENCVFTTGGKLRKRYGTTQVSRSIFGGGSITSSDSIGAYRTELLMAYGGALYSWSPTNTAWANKGNLVRASVRRTHLDRYQYTNRTVSWASSGGINCLLMTRNAGTTIGLYAILVDASSGGVVSAVQVESGLGWVGRVVAFNGVFLVITLNTGTGALAFRRVSLAGALSASTSIATSATAGQKSFDVVVSGVKAFVAYVDGTGNVLVRSIDAAWSVSAATSLTLTLATGVSVGVDTNNSNVMVLSAHSSPALRLSVVNTSLGVVLSGTSVTTSGVLPAGVATDSAGVPRAWFTVLAAISGGGNDSAIYTSAMPSYVPATATRLLGDAMLTSVPFVANNSTYLFCANGGSASSAQHHYLVDALTGVTVARFARGDGLSGESIPTAPWRASVSGTEISAPVQVLFSAQGTGWLSVGVDGVSISLAAAPIQSVEIGGTLLMAGGCPSIYDGVRVTEQGFNADPRYLATSVTGAGGALPLGVIGYALIYEWADATGAIHRSAPVFTSVTTVNAVSLVTFTAPTLRNTSKVGVSLVVFRTVANGTIYYRCTSSPNDTTTETKSFSDAGSVTDAELVANDQLYTTGGVLDTQPCPPASAIATYRNRAVIINSESPRQIWYSKQVIPGEPAEFSDFLVLNMDELGGECSALAPLDDKLIIFKPEVSFYLTGTGPDATGGQNDFSVPVLINTNSGCVEPRSVVTAAGGVMYQSAKGIFILDRSLQDHYIGAPVEAYNSATVKAAVQVPTTNEARFVLSTGDILVYDFHYQQWSSFTGLNACDACVADGVFYSLTSTGFAQPETAGVFTDNGTAIIMRIRLAWLGAGDLQSFLRVYKLLVLGTWKSSHVLNVWVQYDYRTDTPTANKYVIAATSDPSPAQFQYRINLGRQKCEALSLTLFDSGTSGESLDISALTFEVGVKRGTNRLPAGNVL